MELNEINIYRITHIGNIPHILRNGITHETSERANPDFIPIGDNSLIDARKEMTAHVTNGTSKTLESIILGQFTPFYFGVRMPMLYVIQVGGNFVLKPTNPEEIVYVVCSLRKVIGTGNCYYFSDGHAANQLTIFYNHKKILDLPSIIDWDAVRSSYWGGEENLDIKRKKQAEFLVKGDLGANCIIGFGCYNVQARDKLIKFGINETIIKTIPRAYF